MVTQIIVKDDKLTFVSRSTKGVNTNANLASVRANLGAKTFAHRQEQRRKIELVNSLTLDRALVRANKRLLTKNK